MNAPRPGWREPMVWLMLAIPAATVLGGVQTMRLARAGGLDAAPEPVQRTLQAQVADVAPDARAAALRLRASLRVDAKGRPQVALPADVGDDALTLRLVHPTRADGDLAWTLAANTSTWRGPALAPTARGTWILEDTARGWRLVGRWPADGDVAPLEPAVAAP
jgi:hypothetical protein